MIDDISAWEEKSGTVSVPLTQIDEFSVSEMKTRNGKRPAYPYSHQRGWEVKPLLKAKNPKRKGDNHDTVEAFLETQRRTQRQRGRGKPTGQGHLASSVVEITGN